MRFHIGFSFRLKTLKKFLFPILIGILAYFGLGGLFGFIKVNALENFDTTYYLEYNNFYENSSYYHSNDSLSFVLFNAIDYYRNNKDNSQFELFINQCNNNTMCLYLFNKNNIINYVDIYGANYYQNRRHLISKAQLTDVYTSFVFILPTSSNYNVLSSQWFNHFKSCVITSQNLNSSDSEITDCISSYNMQNFFSRRVYQLDNTDLFYTNTSNSTPLISNDNNFTFSDVNNYYYSSYDLYFRSKDETISSSSSFIKKINILNNNYSLNNKVFSYFDIINNNNSGNTNFLNHKKIGNIYVGKIPINNINNFKLDISYIYKSLDYASNLKYNVMYFGRKTNLNNYYSYDVLTCNSNNNLISNNINSSINSIKTTLFNNGFSCSDNLSNYDYIYLYINSFIDDNSFDDSIVNLEITPNYGISSNLEKNLSNGLFIYDKFDDLEPDFQFMLSSQNESSVGYVISDNKFIDISYVDRTSKELSKIHMNPFTFGIAYNRNILVYNLTSYYGGLSDVNVFVDYNTIISFEDNNYFTYYNDSNNLVSDEVVNPKLNNKSNNYNLSYYFNKVDNFLDDINLSLKSFSNITQLFWNQMPDFWQDFIFVLFIFICSYFTYLLIRK